MQTLDEQELLRLSLPEQIATTLRHSIVTGSLPPGTHLREIELAKKLQVSRGPLREALRSLQSEGLVEGYPSRGVFVSRFEQQDTDELFNLREVLEPYATRLAMERMTRERINELETLVWEAKQAARNGNIELVFDLELQLHKRLWQFSDNRRLIRILNEILSQIRAFLGVSRELYVDLFEGINDHEQLLEALRSGDIREAESEMRVHLRKTHQILTAHFRKLNDSSSEHDSQP